MNLRNKSPFYTLFTPRMMSNRHLPTYLDILQHYTYISDNLVQQRDAKMQTIEKIIEIWISASIPVISLKSISNKLDKHIMIISKLKKSEHKLYFSKSVNEHIKKYKILFEICTCKCKHYCLCS